MKVRIASEKGAKSGIEHPLQFARGKIVDTFNNHIGLPRHRDLSMIAGSAVTLLVDEDITLDDLRKRLEKAEMQGIGLRRNEGFGRVAFNHPVYDNACQSVNDAARIRMPNALQRGKAYHDAGLASEATFRAAWKDSVTFNPENRTKLRHEEFDGLVREIRTAKIQSLDDAKALLANYGKAETVMPGGLPGRQKPNFFEAEGKEGLALLAALFEKLSRSAGASSDRWTIGCAMLAEQLALVVSEKKEK